MIGEAFKTYRRETKGPIGHPFIILDAAQSVDYELFQQPNFERKSDFGGLRGSPPAVTPGYLRTIIAH